jgi:hypothetical protein
MAICKNCGHKDRVKNPCPICNEQLISLRGSNERLCSGCGKYFDFDLKPGQKKLHQATR